MNETIDTIKLEAGTEQEKRPISLTLVAWFEIAGGLFNVFNLWNQYGSQIPDFQLEARLEVFQMYHSLPFRAFVSIAVINSIIGIVIGIGIFKRYGWVRILFVLTSIVGFAFTAIDSKASSLFKIPLLLGIFLLDLLILSLLYRQSANVYFSRLADGPNVP